jgi:hypothetical protein
MDPLSISASVAGFLGLAIELKRIISTYVSDVKSAPQEAHELSVEVLALSHVLETLDELLQGEDLDETSLDDGLFYTRLSALAMSISWLSGRDFLIFVEKR